MNRACWAVLLSSACVAHQGTALSTEDWLSQLREDGPTLSSNLLERAAPLDSGAKGDIRDIYRKVAPAVVLIRTPHGYGTGFIVDAQGYVLTNHHVIAGAELVGSKRRVSVELGALNAQGFMEKKGEPVLAWVLKSDPLIDLAVLKLDGPPEGLMALKVSASDPSPGEPVSALGHGGIGLMWAIRDGEVASVGRLATHLAQLVGAECQVTQNADVANSCSSARKDLESQRALLADLVPGLVIQSSCQISPGDSGGPLVNRAGELVGVNAFLKADASAPVTANFHVHVAEVRKFLEAVPTEPEQVTAPPRPKPLAAADGRVGSPWLASGGALKALESGVEGFEHAAVSFLDARTMAVLFTLDPTAQGSTREMEQRARSGASLDFVWVKQGELESFLYDTDQDGTFDTVLQKAGHDPLVAYRDGRRAADLDSGPAVRPLLLKNEARAAALKALGKVFFSNEAL